MIQSVKKITNQVHFINAIKITLATVIPVVFFAFADLFMVGFMVALGALLAFPIDVASNFRHKVKGILVGSIIFVGAGLLVHLTHFSPFLFYPTIVVLLFFLSMISVYGHRASMVSFSGILAVVIAYGNSATGWDILYNAAFIMCGALFYLLIAVLFYKIRPHRFVELQVAQCIELTSEYLKLRGDLWNVEADREAIIKKQLGLQVQLNAIHENLREILLRNRSQSGSTNQNRKMLIVFDNLLEIMELALSTSFDHNKFRAQFSGFPEVIQSYQKLAHHLSFALKDLGYAIEMGKKYESPFQLFSDLEQLELSIERYRKLDEASQNLEAILMLATMRDYAEKQVEKVRVVQKAFTLATQSIEYKGVEKDLEKFLTPLYYPFSTFKENLTFSSTIFRHSLRLTLTLVVGIVIGLVFPLQNDYWILITIVVIMRPGYGLTKTRSIERTVGTIIGGILSFFIIYFIDSTVVISIFSIIAMLLGFTFAQSNYKVGATFVTMYVVFLYGMITPNIEEVLQFRILDTVIGAGLAIIANHFIWPSWEILNVRLFLEKSIVANSNYIAEISKYYNEKGEVPTSYRLARKQAFVAIGNLMESFQRMNQEPKSKQKHLPQIYKLVEMNHTLLSSCASLGTYIQNHQTTQASKAFNVVVESVRKNLDFAIDILHDGKIDSSITIKMKDELNVRFTELKTIRLEELRTSAIDEFDFQLKMQESQLVIEQLVWLTNLSEGILKSVKKLQSEV